MALLTSIKGGQLAGLPSQGMLSCAKKVDLHNGRSASWAPLEGKPQLLLARPSSTMEGQPAGLLWQDSAAPALWAMPTRRGLQ